ncbi:MAG: phage major capsid protein [Rhodobacteraceae bacterium]|nr:phage major capsid protein [Paracoccaceae bacterium]
MNIVEMRRQRAEAAEKMKTCAAAIAAAEAAKEPDADAIKAAVASFETAKADFDKLNVDVGRAEVVESALAAAAVPVDQNNPIVVVARQASPVAKNPDNKGVGAGLFMGALAATGGNVEAAAAYAQDNGFGVISAALSGATSAAGGVTIPQELSSELIEMLRPRVAVRAAGARVVDMPAGNLRNARQATGATATYQGENDTITPSEPTFDSVDKSFKKLTSLVKISNTLLRQSSTAMGQFVRDDMLSSMSLREDLAFIRGDGSGDTPTGLLSYCPGANVITAADGAYANVDIYLRLAESKIIDANVQMVKPAWIMRGSVKAFLAGLKDANGNLAYPSIDAKNTLRGYPIFTTSQIPNNLGGGTNESEIYLADFDQMVIGDSMKIILAMSTEAGTAFADDQTWMRAISEHDFAPRHDEAIARIQTLGWG